MEIYFLQLQNDMEEFSDFRITRILQKTLTTLIHIKVVKKT